MGSSGSLVRSLQNKRLAPSATSYVSAALRPTLYGLLYGFDLGHPLSPLRSIEASHGYVARLCGDDTAWRLGRVSFNPFKHIDPFGTVFLPALLLLMHSPFLFGYAKPVPVNFQALRNPRRDSIWVAAAGPAMNFALATLVALTSHPLIFLPDAARPCVAENLKNALVINMLLAIFNLLPLPPLDGGRIAVGVLPDVLAVPLARLEPYE